MLVQWFMIWKMDVWMILVHSLSKSDQNPMVYTCGALGFPRKSAGSPADQTFLRHPPRRTAEPATRQQISLYCAPFDSYHQHRHKSLIWRYLVASQNCVWNVPRCSGHMERRSFVSGLVPDLCRFCSVMKYRLYMYMSFYILKKKLNKHIYIYI